MAIDKIPSGVRIDPEDHAKITFIAKKECRSLNAQIEYLIKKRIEEYEAEHGKIPVSDEERYAR